MTMLKSRNILRLFLRKTNYHRRYATAQNKEEPTDEKQSDSKTAQYNALLDKYEKKITYNSHLEILKLQLSNTKYAFMNKARVHKERKQQLELRALPPLPVALKYFVEEDRLLKNEEPEEIEEPEYPAVNLPYSKVYNINVTENAEVKNEETQKNKQFDKSNVDKWMTNYEHFDDNKLELRDEEDSDEEMDLEWSKRYGTADPNVRISRVQCGGCGAFLHCNDTAIPGYLPSEIFKGRTDEELRRIECQRCHFLKEFNIALNVSVDPEEYENVLSVIKQRKALVVLMVDLLDFPCSIWPGIVDIIGTQRPIFIVGNKVDLLPGDGKGYLKRVRQSLLDEIKKTRLGEANIKYVSLISARTGYGVEALITKMFKQWLYKGDVFLIGCTNVGKSSLFNALLQSDYCKVAASDIVRRATVSRWPGTTLNMLRFPINRPSGWKIYKREQRLQVVAKDLKAEKALQESLGHGVKHLPMLIGRIGRSFTDKEKLENENDLFALGKTATKYVRNSGINENDDLFRNGRWFYDTPGVVHPEQVLSLLTAEELLEVLPKSLIRPQSYVLRQRNTIFIAGLARLDIVQSYGSARFTVFAAKTLPITIVPTKHANEIYEKFLGTDLLAIPKGNEERLAQWPGLSRHKEVLTFRGEGVNQCCGDVVLSSTGWISISAPEDVECSVVAWTPEARGVNVRSPSMLKHAITLKGKRVWDTPAFRLGKVYVPEVDEQLEEEDDEMDELEY